MKTFNILHVIPTFAIGGVQARMIQLIPLLGPSFKHFLISADGNISGLTADLKEQINVLPFSFKRGKTIANIAPLVNELRKLKPDLLLSYNFGSIDAVIANLMVRCPHIHVEDGFGPDEVIKRNPKRNLARRVLFFLNGTQLIVPSKTLERIAKNEWRLSEPSIHFVPNGIPVKAYHSALRRSRASIYAQSSEDIIIGTAAGLRPEKRLDRLIQAVAGVAKERPTVRLVIAGAGPEKSKLEALAISLGIENKIEWLGHVKSLKEWFRELDIFAMSSDTEQMPIALIEAMAAELSCVATDVGDTLSLLPNPSQAYIVSRDSESLAEKMSLLAGDPALRASLGQCNQAHVLEHYQESKMVEHWRSLMMSAITK